MMNPAIPTALLLGLQLPQGDIGIELERTVQIKFQELACKICEDVCGKNQAV